MQPTNISTPDKFNRAKPGVENPLQDADFLRFLENVRSRRAEIEQARQVPLDIIDELKKVGMYRALLARRYGGDEHSPVTFLRMVEAISAADGSVGWVASFAGSVVYLAGLPEYRYREIYAHGPDVAFAAGLFPVHPAKKVTGGLAISGRWKFASGCTGADILGGGISIAGDDRASGKPRLVIFPKTLATIEENWDVIGLVGTGSHDVVIEHAIVEEDWSFVRGAGSTLPEPIYRFPQLAFSALNHATVGLGIARAALEEAIELASSKASITGAPRPMDRPHVQIDIAKTDAALRAARAFLMEQTEAVWNIVLAGDPVPIKEASLLRVAANNAARVAADVAESAFSIAGTTAIYRSHPLQRHLRDAMVVKQHAFLSEGHYESAGRILFGLPPAPGFP